MTPDSTTLAYLVIGLLAGLALSWRWVMQLAEDIAEHGWRNDR